MEIRRIDEGKKNFLDLLLLADEQEEMIDRYLERGELFALYDPNLKSVAVVTREGEGVCELKNLATYEKYQKRGYGRALVEFLFRHCRGDYETMLVGTGESLLTIPFYEKLGFVRAHKIENFFIDHYGHPMYEDGVQLVDMIYLKKDLRER